MSKLLTVIIPHQLGRAEARRRIEQGFGQLAEHLGPGASQSETGWEGERLNFALKAMGQAISGAIDVADQQVRVEVVLPGVLGMIARKVREKLERGGKLMLEDRRP